MTASTTRRWIGAVAGVAGLAVLGGAGYALFRPGPPPPPPVAAWSARPAAGDNLPTGGLVHTCLLTEAGRALCWGTNNYAQLGDGTNQISVFPKPVAVPLPFRHIDAGDSHTCAVTRDGSVRCWGLNPRGQVGAAQDANCIVGGLAYSCNPTPKAVDGVPASVATGAGADHSCALTAAGAVWCWGSNDRGQLGRGRDPGSFAPVEVTGAHFAQLSVGQFHTCGVTRAGAVLCWGWNLYGQVGTTFAPEQCGPNPWSPTPCIREPVRAEAGAVRFTAVAAASKHTCALAADGRVFCWGANRLGQLGTGTTANATTPKVVAGPQRFRALAVGTDFSCGLGAEGDVWCWGDNAMGQLGGTEGPSSATAVRVHAEGRFVSLGAGTNHACGIQESGAVLCWGSGTGWQLGNGFRADSPVPVVVRGDAR